MRKAQSQHTLYFLMVLIVGASLFFAGMKLFWGLSDDECRVNLVTFKESLQRVADTTESSRASGVEKTFTTPCGVDRVLIFDRSEGILFSGLERYPLVDNILHSKTEDNVFFIKDGELFESIFIENVDIKVPYFLCANTKHGVLKLLVKSDFSGETTLWPQDYLSDCTYDYVVPIELSLEDTLSVLGELFEKNKTILNKTVVDPVAAGLHREVRYEGGDTVIEVSKENGSFNYYESIPKCALESIKAASDAGVITLSPPMDKNISDDPLIMWQFDSSGDESVEYRIEDIIPPLCLRGQSPGLFGLPLADDRYAGISDERRDRVVQERYDLRLEPAENIPARVVDAFRQENDRRVDDLQMELEEVETKVRDVNVTRSNKLAYISTLGDIGTSLEGAPSQTHAHMKRLIKGLNSSGINTSQVFDEHLQDAIINVTVDKRAIERMAKNLSGESYPECDDTAGNWCYDGSNASQVCLNRSHLLKPSCSDGACSYSTIECPGGKVCQDDLCVFVPAGSCTASGRECTDKDGEVFTSQCIAKHEVYNYSCNSTKHCEGESVSCWPDVCIDGTCVEPPKECEIIREDGWVNCTEDGVVRLSQTCTERQDFLGNPYMVVHTVTCAPVWNDGALRDRCVYAYGLYLHPAYCSCHDTGSGYSCGHQRHSFRYTYS